MWYYIMKNEKRFNSKKKSKHHIIPSSRGGKSNLENIANISEGKHRAYHELFSNMTPPEIIDYLVEEWWNGQEYHVYEYYTEYKNNEPKAL